MFAIQIPSLKRNKTGLQPVSRPVERVHYLGGWSGGLFWLGKNLHLAKAQNERSKKMYFWREKIAHFDANIQNKFWREKIVHFDANVLAGKNRTFRER